VNRRTHNAYTVNRDANTISAINSAGIVTATVASDSVPVAISINDLTDQIYVANIGANDVTVIDGTTNSTTQLSVGMQPGKVVVDELRNLIYVENANGLCLSVINGKTNATTTVGAAGNGGHALAVDVLTNRVYVLIANTTSSVAVLSGSTGTFPMGLLDELMGPVNAPR
jgi:YVTN family beta-propeller protein